MPSSCIFVMLSSDNKDQIRSKVCYPLFSPSISPSLPSSPGRQHTRSVLPSIRTRILQPTLQTTSVDSWKEGEVYSPFRFVLGPFLCTTGAAPLAATSGSVYYYNYISYQFLYFIYTADLLNAVSRTVLQH